MSIEMKREPGSYQGKRYLWNTAGLMAPAARFNAIVCRTYSTQPAGVA